MSVSQKYCTWHAVDPSFASLLYLTEHVHVAPSAQSSALSASWKAPSPERRNGSSSPFDNASHGKGASGHLGASSGSSLADAWCPSYQSSSLAWLCMRLSSARTSAAAASASAAREPKAEAPARPPDAPAPDGGRGCCGVLDGGAGCGFGDPPRFFAPPPPRGSAARAAPLLGLP